MLEKKAGEKNEHRYSSVKFVCFFTSSTENPPRNSLNVQNFCLPKPLEFWNIICAVCIFAFTSFEQKIKGGK